MRYNSFGIDGRRYTLKVEVSMPLVVTSIIGEGSEKEEYTVECRGQLRMASGVNSLTYTEEVEGRRVHHPHLPYACRQGAPEKTGCHQVRNDF
jgi:hypothetical protein